MVIIRKEIIKIGVEIKEIESNKTMQKINETKINEIDKLITRFIKNQRERTPKNKIRNERVELTTDTTEI